MRKRRIRIIFLVIAILVAAVMAVMHIEFSHPELRNAATSRLSKALGMPVRMEKLSLKLSQGLKVKNLSLGAEDAEILSAETIILQCNLLEMLRRQFNVRSVVVERPVVTLRKDEAGFLLFPLIATSQQSSSGDSKFQFQLAEARVHDGEVNVENLTLDEIDLEVSSEGKGRPVEIKADGKMQAFDFSILGSYEPGKEIPANFKITTDVDLGNLNLKQLPNLKGTGKTTVNIVLTGSPDELNIEASGELTENGLSYGKFLDKPGGFLTKFEVSSVYSSEKVTFSAVNLELGKSRVSLSGSLDTKGKVLDLEVKSDSIIIPELAPCIPALKDVQAAGEGKVDLKINRTGNEAFESKGRLEVKDWRYGNYGGQHLTCNIKSKGGRTRVDDIVATIGKGKLTGSGEIGRGGKYKFSMKGENIDMKKFFSIKEKDQVKLDMSGKGKMQAQIANSGGGARGLNGGGSFEIQDGVIQSFSWLEDFFSTIHLPELMPFKYTGIAGSFSIKDGKVDIEETAIHGEDAAFATEEGEIDLVRKTKKISADFALAPHLVERERAKFKEFDKFFYVDDNGFAHLSIVWKGPLSEGKPDLTASLLKTGIKRYGEELLEKIFGKDED